MKYDRARQIELIPGVVAGFTQRTGGRSTHPFDSLNLSFSSGDDREVVAANRRLLSSRLGFDPDQLAVAGLVHGKDVSVVTEPGLIPAVDGIVTRQNDILLCVTAADCAVVLFADPSCEIVAACHAGWRGAVAGVIPATLHQMVQSGSSPKDIRAFVGPCISLVHFEVGFEVSNQFDPQFVQVNPATGKPHVDLKAAIRRQLTEDGLLPDKIEIHPGCTFRETDKYYSYRAESGQTGRMMGFIGMRARSAAS